MTLRGRQPLKRMHDRTTENQQESAILKQWFMFSSKDLTLFSGVRGRFS